MLKYNYVCNPMIAHDQTESVKFNLKTAKGQIESILKRINEPEQAQNVLFQIKAVQGLVNRAAIELLDDAYRKALAERVAEAADKCPGDCGQEESIAHLLKIFPEIKPEQIPIKLMEIEKMNKQLQKFLEKNNLDTPPGTI